MGVQETVGLDGDYVRRERLLIPGKFFIPQNLSEEFDLGRRFDLVQSLEVAEHLPRSSGPRFVDSLVRHGDIIFFSAAPQGQGGDQHVNEQSYEYWRRHFERRDYVPIDLIRPNVIGDRSIEPWYRYNSFLYVSAEKLRHLPDAVQQCQTLGPLKDISPLPYKLRKLFLRLLPVPIITKLARIKEKRVAGARAR